MGTVNFIRTCLRNKNSAWIFLIPLFFNLLTNFAHASTEPSAYDIMKPPDFRSVKLSPNGKYVALVQIKTNKHCLDNYGSIVKHDKAKCRDKERAHRSTHQVVIIDLNSTTIIANIPAPENYYISWLEWANDERFLVSLYRPRAVSKGGSRYIIGGSRIVSRSINSDKSTILFEGQKYIAKQNKNLSRITNMLRGDPEHVIMPARKNGRLDLWKVNIITGQATRIAEGKNRTFYWYTNTIGKPILRFDCMGRFCHKVGVFAFNDKLELWKKIKTFRRKPDENEDDYGFWPIAAALKPGQFYVFSNEDTDEYRSIKLYDITTEEFIKTIFTPPKGDVGGAVLNLQTGKYAGAWFYEDRLKYSFEDPKLQMHFNGLNKFFNNQENIELLGFNSEGTKAVIYVSSPNNPGEYHVYNMKTHNVLRLFGTYLNLDERLATTSKILSIPTQDGSIITAYHTYPRGKNLRQAPLLVMPHGGPEVRDYYDYDKTIQYFATHGYQVLQVNFRGSSGFGRKFAEAGYGEWGGTMQNDVMDAVKFLYNQNLASASNACIVGYSYGGYVALYAGASTPKMFKCIVSGGGVSDLLLSLKRTKKNYGSSSESYKYWLKSIGKPKTDKKHLQEISPVNSAHEFKVPVMLIHGENDYTVDISHSEKMYKALTKAGADVEFVKLEDVGHTNWDLETEILYLETVEGFVAKHLKK